MVKFIAEFTATLPNNKVDRRKFPFFLTLKIFSASLFPSLIFRSKLSTLMLNIPMVKPEKQADVKIKIISKAIMFFI
jgi:hypothetical protein